MLENEWLGLLAMTLPPFLIRGGHRQSARRLHDVHPVRIVALHAVHLPLEHRMMLRKVKSRLRLDMTLETGLGVLAGIDDKLPASAACGHVLARRAVA